MHVEQLVQVLHEVAPTDGVNLPAAHVEQDTLPPVEYVPDVQGSHIPNTTKPAPRGQVRHAPSVDVHAVQFVQVLHP